jgi:hypothetical protein
LAVAVLAGRAALLGAVAPPAPSSSIPLATPTLPAISALVLALALARPATSSATRSPRIVGAALVRGRLLPAARIVCGVGPYLLVRTPRFVRPLHHGRNLRFTGAVRIVRSVLFLIARVVLPPPIVG